MPIKTHITGQKSLHKFLSFRRNVEIEIRSFIGIEVDQSTFRGSYKNHIFNFNPLLMKLVPRDFTVVLK